MKAMNRSISPKVFLLLLAAAACVTAGIHIAGYCSGEGFDCVFFLIVLGLWSMAPLLNLMYGVWMKKERDTRESTIIAGAYFFMIVIPALNTSAPYEVGAAHLHLFLLPFLLIMIQAGFLAIFLVRWIVELWHAKRAALARSSGAKE